MTSRSGGNGNTVISGLPFTANSVITNYSVKGTYLTNGNRHESCAIVTGTTVNSIFNGVAQLTIGNVGANDTFLFTINYLV